MKNVVARFLMHHAVTLVCVLAVLLSASRPALANEPENRRQMWRQQQRPAVQQAIRERQMERQMERQLSQPQQNPQRLQEPTPRGDERSLQQGQGSLPPAGPPNDGGDNRYGPGRLSPEQRQALRRQILEAGRSVYGVPGKQ
jgi:hypothetical protein